jgi:hypothetical protein
LFPGETLIFYVPNCITGYSKLEKKNLRTKQIRNKVIRLNNINNATSTQDDNNQDTVIALIKSSIASFSNLNAPTLFLGFVSSIVAFDSSISFLSGNGFNNSAEATPPAPILAPAFDNEAKLGSKSGAGEARESRRCRIEVLKDL